jgi:hypothetical protein
MEGPKSATEHRDRLIDTKHVTPQLQGQLTAWAVEIDKEISRLRQAKRDLSFASTFREIYGDR